LFIGLEEAFILAMIKLCHHRLWLLLPNKTKPMGVVFNQLYLDQNQNNIFLE
jgi:hypothetical protein